MTDYAIGIDLGGTKIAAVLLDRLGNIAAQLRRPTLPQEGVGAVIERIVACIKALEAMAPGPVIGIGLGAPASVDSQRQVVLSSANLGWYDVPVGSLLLEHLGNSWNGALWVDKDVGAGTLCEFLYGAGQGARRLLYVGIGTGVGAGQMFDGRLFHGTDGSDGNIGHFILKPDGDLCGCGKRGCVETLVSGPSIARHAIDAVRQHESSVLAALDPQTITAVRVVEAAKAGDELARRVLAEAAHYLGVALAFYIDVMNPDRIVIGGGVMAAGDLLLDPLRQTIKERALPINAADARIVPAAFSDAGAIGAAALVWHHDPA